MRIVDIRERPIRISRYRDPHIPSGGLTTSVVAVVTDVARAGRPVVGYGFASIGRYAQSGLIRDVSRPACCGQLPRTSPPTTAPTSTPSGPGPS
jgi:D(-)-tartrate dehydratase